jgi:hypothetical protein
MNAACALVILIKGGIFPEFPHTIAQCSFEHEHRDPSPVLAHRREIFRRIFQDHVQNNRIVVWVGLMSVGIPFRRRPVDLYITREDRVADPDTAASDVRPRIERNVSRVENANRLTIDGLQDRGLDMLSHPNMMQVVFPDML